MKVAAIQMSDARLARLFFEHNGKLTDKWEQYLAIYAGELDRFVARATPLRLLEIGVQNGGSLEIWSKYLPPGSTIIGIDIDPAVGKLTFSGNIRAFVADINDMDKVERLIGAEPFDVIVDDGSHTSSDIIATFRRLFPKLAPGGKYIVEDLHASYWKSHEGGLRLRSSSIEYFKDIVDALNSDYFESNDCLSAEAKIEIPDLGRQIARITFYDSVVVIEKLIAEKHRPYRHLLSGQEALVNDPIEFIISAPAELIKPWLVGDAAARSIDIKLKEVLQQTRREIETLRSTLAPERSDTVARVMTQDATIAALQDERRQSEIRVTALESQLAQVASERDAMLHSRTWRATAWLRRALDLLRRESI
jgi:SAM-dependent methyltransferase